uniref:Uncharacterized protein n=1 Tax=Kalanchoe fedtschenkoi TaxID=63787 RepID=A0A7N1A0P4_KALFE
MSNPHHERISESKGCVRERIRLVYRAAAKAATPQRRTGTVARGVAKISRSGYCAEEDPIKTIIFLGSWNHT